MDCKDIAELHCSCGYYSCKAHFGFNHHNTLDQEHISELITRSLSEEEHESLKQFCPVNINTLIDQELRNRDKKLQKLFSKIRMVDKDCHWRIQVLLELQKHVSSTLKTIQECGILPLRSKDTLANSLGELHRNSDFSLAKIKECIDAVLCLQDSHLLKLETQSAESTEVRSNYTQLKISKELNGHSDIVSCLAVSPCQSMIASGSNDKKIIVWQADTGVILHTLKGHKKEILSLDFSRGSVHLVSGSGDCSVKIWDLDSGQCKKTFNGHSLPVSSVVFSKDQNMFASGSHDKSIKLNRVENWTQECTLTGHTDAVTSIHFLPKSQSLVSSSSDCTIKIWDLDSGIVLRSFSAHTQHIWAIDIHQDFVVSVGDDLKVLLSDIQTGHCLNSFYGHTQPINSVAFSPCGNFIASGGDSIRIWTDSGFYKNIKSESRTFAVRYLGNKIVSGHKDKTVRIWC